MLRMLMSLASSGLLAYPARPAPAWTGFFEPSQRKV